MSVDSDLSGSSDGLSGNNTNVSLTQNNWVQLLALFLCDLQLDLQLVLKEKRGVFSGMFKKSPKPLGRRFHSQVRFVVCFWLGNNIVCCIVFFCADRLTWEMVQQQYSIFYLDSFSHAVSVSSCLFQDDVDSLPAQGDVLGSSDSLTENTSNVRLL